MRHRLGKGELQILRSVVQTLIPDTGVLPAAESDVEVSAPVSELLEGAPRRQFSSIRLALWALELSPPFYGRIGRFSHLNGVDRERHLSKLETSRFSILREMFVMFKGLTSIGYGRHPAVQKAIGYSARCEGPSVDESGQTGFRIDPDVLKPVEGDMEFDAIVVGSGAGGAVAAYEIARQGHSVAIIEEGAYYDKRTFSSDPIHALSTLYRDNGLTVLEGRPVIPMPIGKCVGGTTLINSGTCFRAPEHVLEVWRNEFGVESAHPEVLEPIFEDLERELLVEPVDTETMGRNGQLCMEGAASIGATGGPIKRYTNGCTQCGSCPYGCPLDLKQATHVSYIPKAMKDGAKLFTETKVCHVIIENGNAVGVNVESNDPNGRTQSHTVRAKTIVLAAGTVGTPEILSRSDFFKRNENVGKHLRVHPACWVGAKYREEVRGWDGIMQSYFVDQWHDMGILLEATFTPFPFAGPWLPGVGAAYKKALAGYTNLASIGVHLSDRSQGRVSQNRRGETVLSYKLDDEDASRILFGIQRAADIHFAAGAEEVYPHVDNIDRLKPGDQHKLKTTNLKSCDLKLEAFHPMGTARFGSSSKDTVTDQNCRVHGVGNLYVSDASLFPTSLSVNPMLTIMAFASLTGRAIGDRSI